MPDFSDFTLFHAGLSGGKDSTAVALWLRFESRRLREARDSMNSTSTCLSRQPARSAACVNRI